MSMNQISPEEISIHSKSYTNGSKTRLYKTSRSSSYKTKTPRNENGFTPQQQFQDKKAPKQTPPTSAKQTKKIPWEFNKIPKLAVWLFGEMGDRKNLTLNHSAILKHLLKFIVNNDFWLIVESENKTFLKEVHTTMKHTIFDLKTHDPAIFGRCTENQHLNIQQEKTFRKTIERNYLRFSFEELCEVAENGSTTSDISDQPYFHCVFVVNGNMRTRESVNKKLSVGTPVIVLKGTGGTADELADEIARKDVTKDSTNGDPREKLIFVMNLRDLSANMKDEIPDIILNAIKETIPDWNTSGAVTPAHTTSVSSTGYHNDNTSRIKQSNGDNTSRIKQSNGDYTSRIEQSNGYTPRTTGSQNGYTPRTTVRQNGYTPRNVTSKGSVTSQRPASSHLSDSLSGEKGQGKSPEVKVQIGPVNQKNGTATSQTNLHQQKQSLIDKLEGDRERWKFYALCLKLNRIHFVYDLCEHWLHHLKLTKLVVLKAIKRNRVELIAYMLDQDIEILTQIDETFIVEKNKHVCCITNPKDIDTPYHYTTWKCVTCFLPKHSNCTSEPKNNYYCKRPSGLKTKVYSWCTNVPRYRCSQENLNHRIQREIDKFDLSQECSHQTDGTSFSSDESNLAYFCHLANQLFKRAVRMKKIKLAEVLWRHVSYPTSAALYACGVLKVLKMFENNADKQKKLRESITTFEGLACDTINRTYTVYPEYIFDLLMGVIPEWGYTNCIYLAITNYNLAFVSTEPCLELNNRLWYWGTTDTDECMWHMDDDNYTQKTSEGQGRSGQLEGVKRFQDAPHCRVCDECNEETPLVKIMLSSVFCFCHTKKYVPILRKLLAPSVMVLIHLLGQVVFLMLYAILLASVLQAGEFHWLELLVLLWIVTFILEDVNQWRNNPVFKWNELFFVVELISLGLFFVGTGLRIFAFYNSTSETLINYTHVALGLSYIGFSIQLLQICYSNEFFGPLMAMFKNMLLKLLKFLVIIFVFFISYAVASESVLYPRAPLNPQLAYYLTRRAFWGMFGEFLLDELESQEGDIDPPTCTKDPTEYADYSQLRCPTGTGRFFAPVLLGLYFLTVNVLLFNLLIAVFNNEIKRIEEKADGVWKRHALITTLRYHHTLFPPPIFFGLFFPLLKLRLNQERRAPFSKKLPSDKKQQLYKVQNEIQEKYMAEKMKNDFLTVNCRINCPHIDTPEFEQTFSRPVKGDPLTEESAIAVLTTTRPVFINQKNSKGVLVPQKNRLFAVRTRYKYGLRWDCVKVRPLSTKRRRHEPTADDFSVDVDVGKTYKTSGR